MDTSEDGAQRRSLAAAELVTARSALRQALRDELPLGVVAGRAGLSPEEVDLLAVLVACEQDEHLQRLLTEVTDDRSRNRVEVWMLPHLLGLTPAVVAPGSGLVRTALVDIRTAGAFGRTVLAVPPRVLWAMWGDATPEPALPVGVRVMLSSLADGIDDVSSALVTGPDQVRRRERAARALGSPLLMVTPVPDAPAGWDALVREATLVGAGVVVETDSDLDPQGRRVVESSRHLRWALSSRHPLGLGSLPRRPWREFVAADLPPTSAEWAAAVGEDVELVHRLTASQLESMSLAMGVTGGDPEAAYRRLTDARLEVLATHTVPRAGWDDLVLSSGRKQRLADLVARYRNAHVVYDQWGFRPAPARGLVALFSGPSGTGKTLAAEVVAGKLGLDLYRLDLSSVVSKYIGETEKNLDELFDAAAMGNTVLFFDEADSLFGKRTEVNDAQDRHANVETSYLLQRLERYDGIVVMATNYEKNIDEAFLRRVHVRVDFPLPAADERAELWRRNLVEGAPVADDIDIDFLVKQFDLSGASIRNIVVDAAFLAARAGSAIGMAHLVQAAARELHKVGRMVTRDRFGDYFDLAVAAES